MKKIKIISVLSIISILSSIFLSLFKYDIEAAQTVSTDINSINTSKYPLIKEKIESVKKEHPNWNFKILYTGIDWEKAISYEYTGHGSSPKNLVPDSSNYRGDWICEYCGDTAYDSGSWKCASISAIKYMMDPRASLNSTDIFQFLELSYNQQTGYSRDVTKMMVSGSFLNNDTYINTIMDSCKKYNVNPYYIVARLLQEQGKSGSTLTKGQGYNGQYVGYYNAFNIGASGSNKDKVILNGLAKAQSNGWTSLELSIDGGIKLLASSYIAVGQNTLYLQKFDVDDSDGKLYWHQYMQNILAAQNEGTTLRKTLVNINALDNAYTFIIPVFENMPTNTSSRPSTTATPTKIDADLVEVNVTTSLRIRNAPNGSSTKGYLYSGEVVTRLEKATSKVNGTYWDKILKSDGTEGYVARCTYDGESPYKEYLVSVGGTANTSNDSANNETLGDLNNDGQITSADALMALKASVSMIEVNKTLADVNKDGSITSADALLILKYSVGLVTSF